MTQTITNYTTYDQAYYYADLKRLPRLSEEERRHLITCLRTADNPQVNTQVKHQLIESYLPLAKYFAIDLCPKSRYQRDLPDLIGVANLTLVEVITRTDLTQVDDPTSYLAAWMRGRIKGAIARDGLVKIDHQARVRARAKGETDQVYALDHLLSLDEQMEWFDTDDLHEPSAAPLLPTEAAPARDPVLRAQVETWLSYLSPRAQAILRLRYGLSDDNERRHTTNEIAGLLGIDRGVVLTTERDALTRLQALAEGKATLGQQNGKACILYPDAHNTYTITPEQEAAMLHASHDLQGQGIIVTGRLLAQATGVGMGRALMFLRQHRSGTPKEARARQRQQKLEEVCTRLEAQGIEVMSPLLAKEAGVMKKTAIDFPKARRSESHAAN
jgi:RNA polymerase sigma factor (sigma-70 family)